MRPWLARRHWNRFARNDAYWAVLTDPEKQGNRWQVDEFFATGRGDVAATLERVREVLPQWQPTGAALDFGCGVGRLTQGLAAAFGNVTGVDISAEMLALARRHNHHGERVRYLENHDADLSQLADGTFSFVLSLITLQHIAPRFSRLYLAELIRVCAPGGLIVVQIPDRSLEAPPRRRFSLWLPTHLKRFRRSALQNMRRWLVLEPIMEMHSIARAEVEQLFHAHGAEVLAVDPLAAAGPTFTSYRYLARKRPCV